MNKVQLIGRLGKDPEMKTFENGNQVVNFSLATSEKWKDKDGNTQEKTEWHRCSMFGKRAEVISKYVSSGDLFYVEGKISTRIYDDKEYKDIQVTDFEFIQSKNEDKPY